MSRKRKKRRPRRPLAEAPPAPAQPKPKPRAVAARPKRAATERPPAPWGSFPLVEIAVLVGIVMLALAFFVAEGDRRSLLIATGLILASIAGLELSIREHFGGFRSHSTILAGMVALIVLGVLFYAGPDSLPPIARLGIAAAVFAGSFYLLAAAFRRRAGVAIKLR